MTKFIETSAGQVWIRTGQSRETSREIMEAIAFFAETEEQAEFIWEDGPTFSGVCSMLDLWKHITDNCLRDAREFTWGDAGTDWWRDFQRET